VSHDEGASAIHSAEDTSGAAIVRVFVKAVPRLTAHSQLTGNGATIHA